jgi:hypothetical protein
MCQQQVVKAQVYGGGANQNVPFELMVEWLYKCIAPLVVCPDKKPKAGACPQPPFVPLYTMKHFN